MFIVILILKINNIEPEISLKKNMSFKTTFFCVLSYVFLIVCFTTYNYFYSILLFWMVLYTLNHNDFHITLKTIQQ